MAVDDVLDDGKAEARPALVATRGHVDPKEALRQAWHMLGRDARAVIAHGESTNAAASADRAIRLGFTGREGDVHPPPLSPYFTAFSTRFSRIRRSSSRSPEQSRLVRAAPSGSSTPRSLARGARPSAICRTSADEVDRFAGRHMDAHLDPRQGKEVVDQARHAVGLRRA